MINDGSQKCCNEYFYDHIDGKLMQSHPLFSSRPSALQIILYSDEIEICNPLGSHTSKNKLLMFYYTLGNINPKYRSKLASIHLLAMARQSDLSECGVDAILERLHEDLVMLYNEVKIHVASGELEIYGAVVSICGDTLAQHEMCGLKRVWALHTVNADIVNAHLRTCRCFLMKITLSKEHLKDIFDSAVTLRKPALSISGTALKPHMG